jgi:pimeloyl-ACP methyl ester carboxylesterase
MRNHSNNVFTMRSRSDSEYAANTAAATAGGDTLAPYFKRPAGRLNPEMVAGRLRRTTLLVVSLGILAACSTSAPGAHGTTTSTTSVPVTTASPSTTTAATSTVQWSACADGAGPKDFQCATIQVPRDPTHPGVGGTIGLALDRRPATGTKIGSLVINPGGPGASGIDFLASVYNWLPKTIHEHFDVVGFDPPGIGRSAPIVCLDGPGLDRYFHQDPDPPAAGLDALIAVDRTFAMGCQTRSGAELPYVSTVDAAMDMDYIRQAVGDRRLTYLGFSYGTFLGATYAGLFPTHIRAMTLDGAIDPSLSVVQDLDTQAAGFDADLKAALGACVSNPKCPWRPAGDPIRVFQQMLAQVRTHPLAVKGSTRIVGPAEFLYGAGYTLYSTSLWPELYAGLAQAAHGDGGTVLQLYDSYVGRSKQGTYTNEFEANAAVNCLDARSPTVAEIEGDAPAAESAAPVFGVANLYSEFVCAQWPAPTTQEPAAIHAAGAPPILVVGSTGDPATPYADAQALASQLRSGVLLTRVGDGHTAYPYSACIRSYVDDYLVQLTVPPAGSRCRSD